MRKIFAGIGSLVAIAIALVGIPAALVALAGNPVPSWPQLQQTLTLPDYGGLFLVGHLLPIIAWIVWASWAIGFLVELVAKVRNRPLRRLPALSLQQRSAAVLIGAVLVMFTGIATLAPASPADAAAPHVGIPHSASQMLDRGAVQASADDAATAAPPAAAAQPAAPTEVEHIVVRGDTLWAIAQAELGDGARYPELFTSSTGITQPDGRHLTDPNLIYPGWEIEVPEAAPAQPVAPPPPPAPAPAPETSTNSTTPGQELQSGVPTTGHADAADGSAVVGLHSSTGQVAHDADGAGSSSGITHGATVSSADEDEDSWTDEIFASPIRTAGGIGGVLAAGILSALWIRRIKQRRRRKPGQRISMPSEELTPMELELRAVENPMGMDDVDRALRHLAVWAQSTENTLPQLYAIRLATTEISLYLDSPMQLPEPFEAVSEDQQAWVVDPEKLPELEHFPSAPYPGLVTIGQDHTEAHILVDLEHIGALNLKGSEKTTTAALTALAIELATSQWAEDLQITLVGVAEGLPDALGIGRVRHVGDVDTLLRNLRGQAEATRRTLAQLGVDSIEQARSLSPEAEAWIPEIVILGQQPDEQTRAELAELVTQLPRVGIAAVSAGDLVGDWTLELSDEQTATLQPLGLPLLPQLLDENEYARILELLRVTESEAIVDERWVEREEVALADLPPAAVTIEDEASDAVVVDDDDWKFELQRLLSPRSSEPEPRPATIVDEATDAAREAVSNPVAQLHRAPFVRLLGTVSLQGARGEEPRTPKSAEVNRSAVARATELVAFLTVNPGANAVEVHNAFWPGADPAGQKASSNRNALTHKARKWLGNDDAGEPYFPPVGTDGYRLHEVRSDWDLWLELVGDNPSTASTENLVSALKLVQGQPFSGVKDKYYVWADAVRQEMIASIGDAAHELATRALHSGDIGNARLGAAIGRKVDPINETLWRDALRAEHQAGDSRGVERLVVQLKNFLDSFEDGYEAEPETEQLIAEIRHLAPAV